MFNPSVKARFRPLSKNFYSRYVVNVAKSLLGKVLVREVDEGIMAGLIVEVEAYRGSDDPASHAYKGMTKRNRVMWSKPGVAYVYQIYGIHYCLNVVAELEGNPAAVLIRAVEPLLGLELMLKNRRVSKVRELTSGPAKLAKALAIDKRFNGWDLTLGRKLYISWGVDIDPKLIVATRRVGVKDKRPWRFYIRNNEFVSRG